MIKSYFIIDEGLISETYIPFVDRTTIGRSPSNSLRLPDPSVSRQHAIVYLVKDRTVVEDLGSRNGTFVNERRVKKAVLSCGDNLRLGRVSLRYDQQDVDSDWSSLVDTVVS